MKFENMEFENAKADLNRLDDTMLEYGFVREGQWDYERVTYDHKFELNEYVYYLRIMGIAVEGDVGANKALIQLKTPLLGKHYYPHGVEYGSGENFPSSLVAQCENILTELKIAIDQFTE
jgi:YugN-like family